MKLFDEAWVYVIILMDDLCRAAFRDKNRTACVCFMATFMFFCDVYFSYSTYAFECNGHGTAGLR